MIRIRINGRGGQGGKMMAELLAMMLYGNAGEAGKYPFISSSPTFGPERRGAPVDAFVRLSNSEIRERGSFQDAADIVIVLDADLAIHTDVGKGLKDGGLLLVNSMLAPTDNVFKKYAQRVVVATVDADTIAVRNGLGNRTTPIVNTALLGAFIRISTLASLPALFQFIETDIRKKVEANKKAAQEAFNSVQHNGGNVL